MRRPPRALDMPLFSWPLIVWNVLQGVLAFALVALVFVAAIHRGMPQDEARALAFFSLVLSIISLILVNQSFSTSLLSAFRRPNPPLAWILLTIAMVLALSLLWFSAAVLFRFAPLHADDLPVIPAAGAATLLVPEWLKPVWHARLRG